MRLGESDHRETRAWWSFPEMMRGEYGEVDVADNEGFWLSVTEFAKKSGVGFFALLDLALLQFCEMTTFCFFCHKIVNRTF